MLLQNLYAINSFLTDNVGYISGFIGIFSFIKFFVCKKISEKVFHIVITIITILFAAVNIAMADYTEVPDLTNLTYTHACEQLSEYGLTPSLARDGTNYYVVAQSPLPGELVKKGTTVEMNLEPISSNPEFRKQVEDALGLSYGEITVSLNHLYATVKDDSGNEITCFGEPLDDIVIQDAYLESIDGQLRYTEYSLSGNQLTFSNVLIGTSYKINIVAENYEVFSDTIAAESVNPLDQDVVSRNINLSSQSDPVQLPTYFSIFDVNGQPLACSDIQLSWDEGTTWRGDVLSTDQTGNSVYDIWISEDQSLWLNVIDPFGNGNDFTFQIDLIYLQNAEAGSSPVAILSPDGDVTVTNTAEYYNY